MISVIIPVYNVKDYLCECLNSVIGQTYKDLQIIIIDDGSNDGSEKICDEYALRDTRIQVIHQYNQGLSAARNRGLDKACGEWISFIDSDDWIELSMFDDLLDIYHKYGGDIISCNIKKHWKNYVDDVENSLQITELSSDEVIEGLLTQKIVRFEVWNKIWKKSLIGNDRFIVGQVSEDVHFDLNLFMKLNKFTYIDKSLYNYRVNRPGSTNSTFKIKRLCVFDEFDVFIKNQKEMGKDKLSISVATIGCSFAYNLFEEAVGTNQSKALIDDLHKKFKKYYNQSKFGRLKSLRTKIVWFSFIFLPNFTVFFRNRIIKK